MLETILAAIATVVTTTALIYTIVRNFRLDFNEKINKLEERMFYLATGKSLAQAILDEKIKEDK